MDLSTSPWPWASVSAQADEKRREREMYTLSPTSVRLDENNNSEIKFLIYQELSKIHS